MIYIGADHRGIEQKAAVVAWLRAWKMEFVDVGAISDDPGDDYNEYAIRVARRVGKEADARGILICGSGHGMCMQANRFRRVRAMNGLTPELVNLGRRHNNANVLCLAADFVPDVAGILEVFFETKFIVEEKYVRRNRKLDEEI